MTLATEQPKGNERRKELIMLGIPVKCKNCEDRLQNVNDKFNGFCSERCSKIFKGIRKIKSKDLHHIVFWYYLQRLNEYQNRTNKKSGRTLGKLLKELGEIFD